MAEFEVEVMERFDLTTAFVTEFARPTNVTEAEWTAYLALGADTRTKCRTTREKEALKSSKSVLNEHGWREVWGLLGTITTMAKASVLLSVEEKGLFDGVETGLGFSVRHARKKAEQVSAALSGAPAAFLVNGKAKVELQAVLAAQVAVDAEDKALGAALHSARIAAHLALVALDKESKRLYKVLLASYPKGSREWLVLKDIPKKRAAAAPPAPQPPAEK